MLLRIACKDLDSVMNGVFPARVLLLRLRPLTPELGWQASLERKTYLVFARAKAIRHSSAFAGRRRSRMFYVYVIRSISHPKRYYIGFTENIDQRVKEHNEGKSLHTAKYGPWELAVYLAVPSKTKALELERYLKSGSGRAFLQRHIL